MIWMEQYTDKRLRELQQDVIRNRWHTIELEVGCDFPIIRCPLVLQRRVMPMNTMEVLTLLLVVFTALSYIDRHGDDNNKKK